MKIKEFEIKWEEDDAYGRAVIFTTYKRAKSKVFLKRKLKKRVLNAVFLSLKEQGKPATYYFRRKRL